jgi:peroxiredoxin
MIANDYIGYKDLVVAISSNDMNYPQDAPELMTEFAFENNFEFPYLYDETQEVAKAYHAACTLTSLYDK